MLQMWGHFILSARKFCQNRMNSVGGNHPWERIPSKQDEFGWRKSSLRESFVKTGCIRLAEIIPARKFCQNRMHPVGENHPCEEISSNQDEFGRRKSSLGGNFIKSGWIRLEKIISGRNFHQIRMHPAERNHLWTNIPLNQDAFGCHSCSGFSSIGFQQPGVAGIQRECKASTGGLEQREYVDILISVEL